MTTGLGVSFCKVKDHGAEGDRTEEIIDTLASLGISLTTTRLKVAQFDKVIIEKAGGWGYDHYYFIVFEGLGFVPNKETRQKGFNITRDIEYRNEGKYHDWIGDEIRRMRK